MFKIVNPKGIKSWFDGNAFNEIVGHDDKNYNASVSVQMSGTFDYQDLSELDALNVLDVFVLSEELFDEITRLTCRDWLRRKANVFFNGNELPKNYFVLLIDVWEPVGRFKAIEADWDPWANYPVRKDVQMKHGIAWDKELQFPVISREIYGGINSREFNVNWHEYPSA